MSDIEVAPNGTWLATTTAALSSGSKWPSHATAEAPDLRSSEVASWDALVRLFGPNKMERAPGTASSTEACRQVAAEATP